MLKIHGTPGLPPSTASKDKDKERGSQRLEDMMDQFAKRMNELRQVIEAGEHMHYDSDREQQQGDEGEGQGDFRDQSGADVENNNDNNSTAAGTGQEEAFEAQAGSLGES